MIKVFEILERSQPTEQVLILPFDLRQKSRIKAELTNRGEYRTQ